MKQMNNHLLKGLHLLDRELSTGVIKNIGKVVQDVQA